MRSQRRSLAFVLIAAALLYSSAAIAQPADPTHAKVSSWLEENVPLLMEEGRMPGFSIAVVTGGETIYAEGFGLRDTQKVLPATPDTLYGIGSITKSFVAIGIMQLGNGLRDDRRGGARHPDGQGPVDRDPGDRDPGADDAFGGDL